MILELNTDNQAKEILEGQRRYREQMASQYAAGRIDAKEEYEEKIAEMQEKLDGTKAELTGAKAELDTANQTIAELRAEIERLKK